MRSSSCQLKTEAGSGWKRDVRARLALTICLLLGPGTTVALGAGATEDLDASIQAALSAVPPEKTAEAIRFLLDGQLGAASVHAVSPGSLWDHDAANEEQYFVWTDGYFASEGGFGGCAYVPLHLRGDATLTGLVILFVDNWGGEDYLVELRRKLTASNASSEVLASAASTGSSASHRIATDLTVTNGAVDYASYAYFLWVCRPFFGSELHGIYLTYTY